MADPHFSERSTHYSFSANYASTVDDCLDRAWRHYELCTPAQQLTVRKRIVRWAEGKAEPHSRYPVSPEHAMSRYFQALVSGLFVLDDEVPTELGPGDGRAVWALKAAIQGLGLVRMIRPEFPIHSERAAEDVNRFCFAVCGERGLVDGTMLREVGCDGRVLLSKVDVVEAYAAMAAANNIVSLNGVQHG